MKAILSQINKNAQKTDSVEKEAGIQINDLEHKEEKKHSIRVARRKRNKKT